MSINKKLVSVCVFLICLASLSPAQKSGDNSGTNTTFRSKAQLVLIPTVVTRKGEPVRGLTKDNFVIDEDGKGRPVQVFEAIETKKDRISKPAANGAQFSNALGDDRARALTLIIIDGINTPTSYQEATRRDVIKFLSRNIKSDQLVGVVLMTPKKIDIISDFTTDASVLLSAMQQATGSISNAGNAKTIASAAPRLGEPATPAVFEKLGQTESSPISSGVIAPGSMHADVTSSQGEVAKQQLLQYIRGEAKYQEYDQYNRIKTTLESFQQIANGLAGYPGRKAVVWASASFEAPLDPFQYKDMSLIDLYQRTIKVMADSNVVVYPVDVRGLQTVAPGADATVDKYDRDAGVNRTAAEYRSASERLNTFRNFAESTGGRVFFDVNNNDKAFEAAIEDSQVYYMLGFYADAGSKEGWHKLKVKLVNSDGAVHARNGFYYSAAALDPEASRKRDIQLGARSPIDYTSLRLNGEWLGTTAIGSKKKVEFGLQVPPESGMLGGEAQNQLNLDIVVVARTIDTKVAAQASRTISASLKPENVNVVKEQGVSYRNALELDPGRYQVNFLVRDNFTGRMGSVEVPLTVD